MYKIISKSKSDTWDDISRRAYGTPNKGENIARMNNNIEEGEVLALEESETESDDVQITGEVYVVHQNNSYSDFSEYTLFDGMEAVKGAVFIFNETDLKYDFSFNDSIIVCDERKLFLKGRIANIKPCLTSGANWTQIEVESHAGILKESVMPYPFEFSNRSIRGVLEQVAGYYNQKIEFSSEAELDEVFKNEIGTSFTAKSDETVWDFMKRICHSRGLILTDTGDGLFIGRFKPNTPESLNLLNGECLGVKEIRGHFVTVGLGRYYELNSQYPTIETATIQIPFPVPITKRFDSNDYNALDLESTARRLACSVIREHFKIEVLLSENVYLQSGDFMIVKNEKIKLVKETDFIVERVERRHPDETYLILTLPCAYTFEIPVELPLC